MTMLAAYDRARAALATALQSTQVSTVLASRAELDHIKLHARQIKDRTLLAEAIEYQMWIERRLGDLLAAAEHAGMLAGKGQPRKVAEGETKPATLKEIGVDPGLSMKAKRAAAMPDEDFKAAVAQMRDRMASNKAIMVDPVQAHEKASDLAGRRAAHAERAFAGGTVDDLKALAASGYRAKCFYLDPNWDFRTRSPAGDGRSANVHYNTAAVEQIIRDLEAVPAMAAEDSAMLLWMVDWAPRAALDLIEALGFEHKTTAFTWAKQNEDGDGWHMGQGYWTRANPEDCWLATKGQPKRLHADVRQLVVAPVMEHSRKPDLYDEIERLVEGPYLELYARRPRKGWTSWGNELEFTGVAA